MLVAARRRPGLAQTIAVCASGAVYADVRDALALRRVRWSPQGTVLASGSDDRTVRVWDIPWDRAALPATAAAHAALQARRVLGRHGARVWDIAFEDERGDALLTAGEDCLCRCDPRTGALAVPVMALHTLTYSMA